MNAKNRCFYLLTCVVLLTTTPSASAITTDELANMCRTMESAITDISVEYEWFHIPPRTFDESDAESRAKMLIAKDGVRKFQLSAARSHAAAGPNDPNFLLFDRLLQKQSTTLITEDGHSWHQLTTQSYNGHLAKHLSVGGSLRETSSARISSKKPPIPLLLTPLGFSVLRFSMSGIYDNRPLSECLRLKELVRLDNTLREVDGFNTIRVDLLQESTKQVCMRVYFSLDHAYAPVRYEYVSGADNDPYQSVLAIEIHSLEQVREQLWFPTSGLIRKTGREHVEAYDVIGSVTINQGLTDDYFDIDFPPGTKVYDEINDRQYVTKPSEEQFE